MGNLTDWLLSCLILMCILFEGQYCCALSINQEKGSHNYAQFALQAVVGLQPPQFYSFSLPWHFLGWWTCLNEKIVKDLAEVVRSASVWLAESSIFTNLYLAVVILLHISQTIHCGLVVLWFWKIIYGSVTSSSNKYPISLFVPQNPFD